MDNKEFLDKLNRAYQMEEEMAEMVIDLCYSVDLPEDLAEPARKRIKEIFFIIKSDTLRHKKIVSEMIKDNSRYG